MCSFLVDYRNVTIDGGTTGDSTIMPKTWDVFISHASEDKAVVRELFTILNARGLRVWLDEGELVLGDSLRQKIDQGLSGSRFGVVVLSPAFFRKAWPQAELDALVARESGGIKVILPVWHGLSQEDIVRYSPLLAGRLAVHTSQGLDQVSAAVLRAVGIEAPIHRVRVSSTAVEFLSEAQAALDGLSLIQLAIHSGDLDEANKRLEEVVAHAKSLYVCGGRLRTAQPPLTPKKIQALDRVYEVLADILNSKRGNIHEFASVLSEAQAAVNEP